MSVFKTPEIREEAEKKWNEADFFLKKSVLRDFKLGYDVALEM